MAIFPGKRLGSNEILSVIGAGGMEVAGRVRVRPRARAWSRKSEAEPKERIDDRHEEVAGSVRLGRMLGRL